MGYGDYNTYVQAPPTYYASAQAVYQPGVTASAEKVLSSEKRSYLLDAAPGYSEHLGPASTDGCADSYFKRRKVY
ncbi:hypothetical protein GDO81_027442 [Engystomops pustulosus]|uniref:Uncharacterized protein n=1 Tax=Engystomops pustulosus TaxID=76066 RepID=A0AAV6YFF0_ENGPU|nr:hypothetical protein GDO81_027442 [Engystomops pustulosus]